MNTIKNTIPPCPSIDGWESVIIDECNEKLISLRKLSPNNIIVEPQYYLQGISGALEDCYVRETVGQLLFEATKKLPKGCRLVIWDAWRPIEVQQCLFDNYLKKVKAENPNLPQEKLIELSKIYVSLPSKDETKPSPHNTGGAIDINIKSVDGKYLEMGTQFDEFSLTARTRYYEEKEEKGKSLTPHETIYRKNRRFLYHVFTEEGFSNYPEEWWHFDYGDQFWGKITQNHAIYNRITLD